MVNDIRLYIGDYLVEFDKAPDILYNWCETDFTNPIITKNSYSKTIRIKGTKNNNKIFGQFWNLERYNTNTQQSTYLVSGVDFNASKKVRFTIYVNGNIFEKGYLKLNKVSKVNDVYEYEISLFGGLGSFLYNLSTKQDNTLKTFADLWFLKNGVVEDLGFTISKETVLDAWDNIGNRTINFMPSYNGVPENFDSNKALTISHKEIDIDGDKYNSYNGYVVGEFSSNLDMWEVGDLRSYLQTPIIKVSSIFESLQHPNNSKGEYDNGYEVVLDTEFFNDNNPYYIDSYITLPSINTLNFEDEFIEPIKLTNYTVETDRLYRTCGVTENTTITYQLPEVIDREIFEANVEFTFTQRVTGNDTYPDYLIMQNLILEAGKLASTFKTGLAIQVLALDSNDNILNGSVIDWYTTTPNKDTGVGTLGFSEVVECGNYRYLFLSSHSNKHGFFKKIENTLNVYDFVVGEDSNTNPITMNVDLPIGTKKIAINMQRCSEPVANPTSDTGCKLFGIFSNIEYFGYFNYIKDSSCVITSYTNNSNFISGRYISQNKLLTTNYSVADWLISYCKMFGLYLHKDIIEDKIYIDTRNTYYKRMEVEDISGIIDYSKEFIINPVYMTNKFYTLTQPMEKTKYSKFYSENHHNEYGCKVVDTGFDFVTEKKELLSNFKIKTAVPVNRQNIYNVKPYNLYNGCKYNGFKYNLYKGGNFQSDTYEITLPKLEFSKDLIPIREGYYDSFYKMCFEDDRKPVDTSGVMVLYNGMKDVGDLFYYVTDDNYMMFKLNNNTCWWLLEDIPVNRNLNKIPQFSSYQGLGSEIEFSTNFGSPREFFVPSGELFNNDKATLYSQFYSKYYEDLFDANTRVVDCYIKPETFLNADSLRKLYWFNNGIWRLNKITDYSPTENRTVKCQFIKIHDIQALTSEIPQKQVFEVTVNDYFIPSTGGIFSGRVNCSSEWEYISSKAYYNGRELSIDEINVTPSTYNGSTNFSFEVAENRYSVPIDIKMLFQSNDIKREVTIKQQGVNTYFKWDESQSSALNAIVENTTTSYTASFTTNIEIYFGTDGTPGLVVYRNGRNSIICTIPVNETELEKKYTINVYDTNNVIIGFLKITQEGIGDYFIWDNSGENTDSVEVPASQTSYTAYYSTSYDTEGLYFTCQDPRAEVLKAFDDRINVKFPENTSIGVYAYDITVYHEGKRIGSMRITQNSIDGYFRWEETGTNTITVEVLDSVTSVTKTYISNMDNITFEYSNWITGVTDTNKNVLISFGNNTGSQRTESIIVKSGGIEVGRITIIQKGITPNVINLKVNESTQPLPIPASISTFEVSTNPNLAFTYNVKVDGTTWKSSQSGVLSDTYTCGMNTGNTIRTITIVATSDDGTCEETVIIKQEPPLEPSREVIFKIGSQTQDMTEINNTPNLITYRITDVKITLTKVGEPTLTISIGEVLTLESLSSYTEKTINVFKEDSVLIPNKDYQVTLTYTIKLVNSEANTLNATTKMSETRGLQFVNGEATVRFLFVLSSTDTEKQIEITKLEFN